jgi:hypothetical protein
MSSQLFYILEDIKYIYVILHSLQYNFVKIVIYSDMFIFINTFMTVMCEGKISDIF